MFKINRQEINLHGKKIIRLFEKKKIVGLFKKK